MVLLEFFFIDLVILLLEVLLSLLWSLLWIRRRFEMLRLVLLLLLLLVWLDRTRCSGGKG